MAKKVVAKKGADDDKIFAFLGSFLTILGFIIVLLAKKDSKYAMYYGKQGLVLGITWIAVWIVVAAFGAVLAIAIPLVGSILLMLIWAVLGLGMFILWIITWINSLSGQMKPMPILQTFADRINI